MQSNVEQSYRKAAVTWSLKALSRNSQARLGVLHTPHGVIDTPVFMPVGTLASVKSLDAGDLHNLGAKIMLANAYHLMLRPGAKQIADLGGLQRFMGYQGSVLTDSGGFQVFSLAKTRRVDDAGITFRSHIDGAPIRLTPQTLVQTQEDLGSDIAMVLDECPPAHAPREVVLQAMRRTSCWAEQCLAARRRNDMGWFGIVQGALFEDLRAEHAQQIGSLPFDGFAIGGVSVGEATPDIHRIVHHTAPLLPADKPRYLMGVGTPEDLVHGVAAGVDMFDCVMPTRNARNGYLFTSTGRVSLRNAAWRHADIPIDASCNCYTCQHFSRAYLRHLLVSREMTYYRLATIHNISFYLQLMQSMRTAIANDTFSKEAWLLKLAAKA